VSDVAAAQSDGIAVRIVSLLDQVRVRLIADGILPEVGDRDDD